MRRFIVLMLLLLLAGCGTQSIVVHTADGAVPVIVEIADTEEEHAVGLMFREEMGANNGMLFVFDGMEQRGFWMKNTKIPLDLIFIADSGEIVDMMEGFAPCTEDPCPSYISQPAQYVLEVNAGFAAEHGIVVGDTVDVGSW